MKYFLKKICLKTVLALMAFFHFEAIGLENKTKYSPENFTNYLSGVMSLNIKNNEEALKYFREINFKNFNHSNFNLEFIRTLVLLEKFDEAIAFSKNAWNKEDAIFEADLLLGLNYFVKKDYIKAEQHFKRLNKVSKYNIFFDNFIGNMLMAWTEAAKKNEYKAFSLLQEIPKKYSNLKQVQNIFLHCHFNSSETQKKYNHLINNKEHDFSRYNFFLANYLLSINKVDEAKKIIFVSAKKHDSNLLLKQTRDFLTNNNISKTQNVFDCKNPKDALAEFFYIIANLYASEEYYKLSNFYLKISLYINKKFKQNKALLAENYFYQEKHEASKKVYGTVAKVGDVYFWHSAKNISAIYSHLDNKKESVSSLKKAFSLLKNPDYRQYYEMANFYKDNKYYEESIKFYSLSMKALEKIEKNHSLIPKILEKRGSSYERIGEWEKAERDLKMSLTILPDQAYVLNYLAYSWIEKKINIDEALKMLIKASELRKNDAYIIDSLGWAYYALKDYHKAKKYLQRAVELMPFDPVVNDHYGDALWMTNKSIQARYFWKHSLSLEGAEDKLKNDVRQKLIEGILKKS